jgi:ribosome biogenesis protein Nip4
MKAKESDNRRRLLHLLLSELAQYHRVSDILKRDPNVEEVNDFAMKFLDVLVEYATNEVRIHLTQIKELTRLNYYYILSCYQILTNNMLFVY